MIPLAANGSETIPRPTFKCNVSNSEFVIGPNDYAPEADFRIEPVVYLGGFFFELVTC